MYWIIGSVIISAIIAAISTIASTHKTWIKRLLIVLAVAGLVIGVAECVKQNETLPSRIYCSTISFFLSGLLIQTDSGKNIGLGSPFLKRSGFIS